MGHYSQDMASGQGSEMNNILRSCRCSFPSPAVQSNDSCSMFSTHQLDALSLQQPRQSRWQGPSRIPPHQPGISAASQWVPHRLTQGEQAQPCQVALSVCFTEQWAGSWAGIKQSSSTGITQIYTSKEPQAFWQREPFHATVVWRATGCVNVT